MAGADGDRDPASGTGHGDKSDVGGMDGEGLAAGESGPEESPADELDTGGSPALASPPRLGSRVLLTWIELTVVGITGGALGATVGGPPGFIIYLLTTLLSLGVIFYNVNELIKAWLRFSEADRLK